MESPPVFVWRSAEPPRRWGYHECHFCSAPLHHRAGQDHYVDECTEKLPFQLDPVQKGSWDRYLLAHEDYRHHAVFGRARCDRCGWWFNYINTNTGGEATSAAVMRVFEINDSELLSSELCAHLAKRFSDVYSLTPRRFEEAVAQVYRQMGWTVELTKQTRDGGIDLVCLRNATGHFCIVECKRFAPVRTVGIGTVDRLIGVSVRTGSDTAHLVISSHFSRPAKQAAKIAGEQGVLLSLIDADELFRLLQAYSDPDLTVDAIRSIFAK